MGERLKKERKHTPAPEIEALPDNDVRFRVLFEEGAFDAVFLMQGENFIDCNRKALEMFGVAREEIIGSTPYRFSPEKQPDGTVSRQAALQKIQLALQGKPQLFEWKHCRGDGSLFDVEISLNLLPWRGEAYIQSIVRDITRRKQAEEELFKKSEEQELLLDNIETQVWYLKDVEHFGAVNRACADFFGLSKKNLEGKNIRAVCSPEEAELCIRGHKEVFSKKRRLRTEEWLRNGKGEKRLLSITRIPKLDADGNVEYVICTGEDITERKQVEEKLKYLSMRDPLTGLYNRAYFEEEMKRLEGSREYPITIISADLDGLKLINDALGHKQGDEMLNACADILRRPLRKSVVLARIGGDEFAAVMGQTDEKSGQYITKRIQAALADYNRTHPTMPLSISIGVATTTDPKEPLNEVFRRADDAMYRHKLYRSASIRSQVISGLLSALSEKDYITQGHAVRVQLLCHKLGERAGLSPRQLVDLSLLAQVHDLGKVGIPDDILLKKGTLTEDEWEIMRQHSEKGYRIARSSPELAPVAELILYHHEHWDGSGYPLGLKGTAIPIECRILAVVDAYDSMTNDRPYCKARSVEEATGELKRKAGSQFDPVLIEKFLEILEQA